MDKTCIFKDPSRQNSYFHKFSPLNNSIHDKSGWLAQVNIMTTEASQLQSTITFTVRPPSLPLSTIFTYHYSGLALNQDGKGDGQSSQYYFLHHCVSTTTQ